MIIGMIRYAIPNAFVATKNACRDIIQLYEEPYFSDRFKIFCNITLESFNQQTNKDFKLLIYHTNLIPENKKMLFDEIEEKYKFVKNMYIPDKNLYVPKDLIEDINLTFRIDNDDGISIDFIEKLQQVKLNYKKDKVISFPHIHKLVRTKDDEYKIKELDYLSNSIGLAYVTTSDKTIMDLGIHTKLPKSYDFEILDGNGGLQIINGYNVTNCFDSKVGKNRTDPLTLNKKEMENLLIERKYAKMDLSSL